MAAGTSSPRIKIGERYGPYEGRIDPDAVVAFVAATNDPNPVYAGGRKAPPLQTISLLLASFQRAGADSIEPGAIEGVRGGVHAEQDLRVHRPLTPGAHVSWEVIPYSAQPTPAGVLVSQRIVISDEGGPAVEHFWSSLSLGGTIPEALGPPLADHTFPDGARERKVGSHRFDIARDQAFRYGGVSGDRSPMHLDDEVATRMGYPSKFMQGMCSFAMCSGAIVKLAAAGDPDRLRRLACRFSAPVFPGNELVVDVYDAGPMPSGIHAYAFEAVSAGVTVIKHGRAEVSA